MVKTNLRDVIKWCVAEGLKESGGRLRLPVLAKTEDKGDGLLGVTISTNTIDRHGDMVQPGGMDAKAFRKNPVVMWAHDYTQTPIGKASNVKRDNERIIADVEFAPTEFAGEVYSLYAKGFLQAWSIGFIPVKWDEVKDEDDQFTGYDIKKWELLEFSAVPIPANPEALTNAMAEGVLTHKSLMKSLGIDKAKRPEGSWKYCVCDECGHYEDHEAGEPCGKCPKCGVQMHGSDDKPSKDATDVDPGDVEQKPGWDETETSYRRQVREPGKFDEDTFKTVAIKKDKPRINSVMGKLKGEDTMTIQSLIFPKEDDWTLAEAKKWVTDHPDVLKMTLPCDVVHVCLECGHEWQAQPEVVRCPNCNAVADMNLFAKLLGHYARKASTKPGEEKLNAMIQEIVDVKEGRELSTKNRAMLKSLGENLMQTAEAISNSVDVIDDVLAATEPHKEDDKIVDPEPETESEPEVKAAETAEAEVGSQEQVHKAARVMLDAEQMGALAGRVADAVKVAASNKLGALIGAEFDRRMGRVS